MTGNFLAQMKLISLIFIGGGLGSIVRYLLGKWLNGVLVHFPLGTLLVNIAACFILGMIISYTEFRHSLSMNMRVFLAVGFCGGFSTFSAFSMESFQLFYGGMNWIALGYILLSVVGCLVSCWAGFGVFR